MPKANRICKTCGTAYFYCNNCGKKDTNPQWMLMWDTENCKNVFEIVSNYAQKVYTKAVAKKKLSKCDLSKLYTFKENIRALIEEINAEDKVETKASETTETKAETKVETKDKEVAEKPKEVEKSTEEDKASSKRSGLFNNDTEAK